MLQESEALVAAIGLLALCVALSFLSPHFLTVSNVLNVLRQVSVIAVVSVGMTYVIPTAGIDLSVGSVLGLSAVVAAIAMKASSNVGLGIFVIRMYPAGKLPPIKAMSMRDQEQVEEVIKEPFKRGKHIYMLGYPT